MKKFLSSVLCLAMLLSMGTTVFADWDEWEELDNNITTDGGHQNVTVTYGVSESFIVTIPSNFTIGQSGTATADVSASNVMISAGNVLDVYISGHDYSGSWELIDSNNNNNRLTYTIGTGAGLSNIVNNSVVLSVEAGEAYNSTVYETMHFTIVDELTSAGIYTDTLTFTVNVAGNSGGSSSVSGILEGDGQTYHKMAPSSLSFRSTAPLDEFQNVLINGQPLDNSAYTLTEGSTIVSLDIDYLDSLDIDKYEISVVSDSGARTGTFDVVTSEQSSTGFYYYNQPYYAGYVEIGDPNMPNFSGTISFIILEDGSVGCVNASVPNIEYAQVSVENNIYTISFADAKVKGYFSNDGLRFIGTEVFASGGGFMPDYTGPGIDFFLDENYAVSDDEYLYILDDYSNFYKALPIDSTKSTYIPVKSNINNIQVLELASNSFSNNENLVVANMITAGIEIINAHTFYMCSNLKSITIPKTVNTIHSNAFYDCPQLNTIIFEGTIEEWNNLTKYGNLLDKVPATHVQCSDGTISIT